MIENTEKLLSRLGEQLELVDSPKISLVICGGSALNVTGLVKRTTKDIDVLGQIKHEKVVKEQLPESFWMAAETVREEFDLEEGWINDDPSPMVEGGLPEGLEDRLLKKNYGTKLTVGYVGRLDQIYFKLWASADRNPESYHVQDLKKLDPTSKEIEGAARWCMKQDPSEGFRQILVNMLQELGFEDVSKEL